MADGVRLSFAGGNLQDLVDIYYPLGNYTRTDTAYSSRVKGENGPTIVQSDRWVGPGLLRLIGMMRQHVEKNVKDGVVKLTKGNPAFNGFSKKILFKKQPGIEIDISAAYATAAHKIGAVSGSILARLMSVTKESRLMIVGSLGTRKLVTEFVDGNAVDVRHEENETLRRVWKEIILEVDRTMKRLADVAGEDFLMYWTDAVFVREQAKEKVIAAAKAEGYNVKFSTVSIRKDKAGYVKTGDGRTFYVLGDAENFRDVTRKNRKQEALYGAMA